MASSRGKGSIQWRFGLTAGASDSPSGSLSEWISFEEAIAQLESLPEDQRARPIQMRATLSSGTISPEVEFATSAEALNQLHERTKRLPILIVPGFICCGLLVESSSVCPDWEGKDGGPGKRVWLDIPRLGLSAIKSGSDTLEESEDGESLVLKNKWLRHLTLKNAEEEADGIHLQVVPGLAGVKFLDPNLMFGMAAGPTRIFANVTDKLEEMGYTEGKDLDAENFDWRFAPGALQQRAQYFDKLIAAVERIDCHDTGVVLLAHSMGNKVAQYFFEHAKEVKGQAWLDAHIHLWLASAAPLLGSLQAVKAALLGDRFGLDAVLSLSEALIMARSFSSTQWMFPIGKLAQGSLFLRRQGVLQIKGLHATLKHYKLSRTRPVQITLEVKWGKNGGKHTHFLESSNEDINEDDSVIFEEVNNLMHFAGPPELPQDATITATIKEWVIESAHPIKSGLRMFREAIKGHASRKHVIQTTDETLLSTVLGSQGDDGFTDVSLNIPVGSSGYPSDGKRAMLLGLVGCKKDPPQADTISFKARWLDYSALRREWLGSEVLSKEAPSDKISVRHLRRPDEVVYDEIGLSQLMAMEGCKDVAEVWDKYYEEDSKFDAHGRNDCPPIRQVLSVHGVDLPTDVGYVLKLNQARFAPKEGQLPRLVLDTGTEVVSADASLTMKGGTIYEGGGDGVVPRCSMEHCLAWKEGTDVRVERIPGAEHRVVLHDKRFTEVLSEQVLHKMGGWSTSCSAALGPSLSFLEDSDMKKDSLKVFDKPTHVSLSTTVNNLNTGALVALADFCVAYSTQQGMYHLLWRKNRQPAALIAIGAKGREAMKTASS